MSDITQPSGLLLKFAVALAQAEVRGGALAAEAITFQEPEWFEDVTRVYADPATGKAGVGPYVDRRRVWGELLANVPSGAVVIGLSEGPAGLDWWRGTKSWSVACAFHVGACADAPASLSSSDGDRRWHPRSTRSSSCPPRAQLLWPFAASSPAVLVTGPVVPLMRSEGPEWRTLAFLFLAKRDVRFRRLGLWGLRHELLASLSPPLAQMLTRGRAGRLVAADFA